MTLVQVIKAISFKSLPSLVGLALYYPLFVIPTLQATRKTVKIAQREYGNAHKGNTKANAFRHALWNVLIAKHCLKWKNNKDKVVQWTEKITTKHEDLAPNPPLERAMDLHNNHMGQRWSEALLEVSEHIIIDKLKQHAENARKVSIVNEITNEQEQLVYIDEV